MWFGILRGRPIWLRAPLAAAIVIGALAASHAAATFFGLTFPDRVADARLVATTDYEKSSPGLGYGARYSQPTWGMDVYIYDRGYRSIPEDLRSEVVEREFQNAQDDIFELQRRGHYDKVELLRTHVIRNRLMCSDFVFVHWKLGKVDSFLCLAGWSNKFVKFRLTRAHTDRSAEDAARFLGAWSMILWP